MMIKNLLVIACISTLTLTTATYADSCTLQFSIADYGTVYNTLGYSFIPFSSINPQENGGGQFSAAISNAWMSAPIIAWGNKTTLMVSDSKNCDVLYKKGVTDVQAAYADALQKNKGTSAVSAQPYCLTGKLIPEAKSQTVIISALGGNDGTWIPCG